MGFLYHPLLPTAEAPCAIMTAPVRETYSLSSCIWRGLNLCSEHEIHDRDSLGHTSFLRRSSTLSPSLRFLSISSSFVPPGANQDESNHSCSWQRFRYLNKVIVFPQSILFSKQSVLRSSLHAVCIPGPSVSWLAVWCPIWHSLQRNTESREPPVICTGCVSIWLNKLTVSVCWILLSVWLSKTSRPVICVCLYW